MSFVAIPTQVFESPRFWELTHGQRDFLFRLYHLFGDCDTFRLEYKTPSECREPNSFGMLQKVRALIDAGLLVVHEKHIQEGRGPRPRVFKFVHSAVPFYEAA